MVGVTNGSEVEVGPYSIFDNITIGSDEVRVALIAFLLTTIVLYVTKEIRKKKYNLPPGPLGLPILGYMPFIGTKPHKTYYKLSKKYGNIFGMYLGRQYTVILNDIGSIKEAFSSNDFSGRPVDVFKFTDKYDNIINMNGKPWIEHMRFNKTILRELGMGKGKGEEIMKEELQRTLSKLEALSPEQDVDLCQFLSSGMDNVIYSMVCGKRYDEGEPMAKILHDYQIYMQRFISSSALHGYFPYLKNLWLRFAPLMKGATKAINNLEDALCDEIETHRKSLDENNLTDFMDYSLAEINRRNGEDLFNYDILNGTSQILLLGGSETTRVTLEWSFMLLAKHQDIQEKTFQEIKNVCGTEKLIGWSDRESLPYLNALIMEIQRRKILVPLNAVRRTQRDTTVGGYEIPENTTVIANFWAVHMDPNMWEDPKQFKPERFLIKNGTQAKAPENHIPFSYGQRMCPGERLAAMQLFLSLSNTIQRFKIKPPKSGVQDFTGELRLVYVPNQPIVRFEKR